MTRRQRFLIRLVSIATHAAALAAAAFLWPAPDAAEARLLPPAGPTEFAPHAPEPLFHEDERVDSAPLLATMPEEAYELTHLPPDLAEASFVAAAPSREGMTAAFADPPTARIEILCLSAGPRSRNPFPRMTQPRRAPVPARRSGAGRGARVRRLPEPEYPASCRREGHEGSVAVEVEVLPSGRAGRLRIARCTGCKDFIPAAMEAARRATFRPATRDGHPVTSRLTITYRFRIR